MRVTIFQILLGIILVCSACKSNWVKKGEQASIIFSDTLISKINNHPPFQYIGNYCNNKGCIEQHILNGKFWYPEINSDKRLKGYTYEKLGNYKRGYKHQKHLTFLKNEESVTDVLTYYKLKDKKKGEIVIYSESKNTSTLLLVENFSLGLRQGNYIVYDKYGKQIYKTKFKKGTGYEKFFYPNGTLWHEGQLKKGIQVGIWKYYDERGELAREEDFGDVE